ncbi:TonB family protein [Glycocaulis alkaliphilus]|nr:TonB family protein [Glycocaulis alkaliphilus]GGB78298.1 hypothetical protein GCM10007417_17770 [Glycocaulis alkaliphilus]
MPPRPRHTLSVLIALSATAHATGTALFLTGYGEKPPAEPAAYVIALGSTGAAPGAQPVQPPELEMAAEPTPERVEEAVPEPVPERPAPESAVERAPDTVSATRDQGEEAAEAAAANPVPVPGADVQTGEAVQSPLPDTQGESDQTGRRALADHDGLVLAALANARRYPPRARINRVEGAVGVMFEIDRNGRVRESAVTQSSGSGELDRAALDQIARAAPFPPAPESVHWHTRRYVTEIRFSLRQGPDR